ncbi:MAG: TerB family tellurite resistance protein [Cyclobacteriaceae bacterium]|nr:TerB family tellurite resistance protein [Cyclobacteriaceae bacterium]
MPIQRFFTKKITEVSEEDQLGYICQLFKMAHSDGHMDECEYHFILKVAQRLEIEVDFESLHRQLTTITFDQSSHQKYGFDLLFDLSWLMLVDGEVDDRELQLGAEIASQMGYFESNVKEIVTAIGEQKKMGLPPLEIKEKLKTQFAN